MTKRHLLMTGPLMRMVMQQLDATFEVHRLWEAADRDEMIAEVGAKIEAIAVGPHTPVDGPLMSLLPNLKIVSNFGVGYDTVDAKWAGEHGIYVTNTPDVLNEEVADTALGLLLCTVREFPQADRYVRAGKWPGGHYPLTKATLRNRTVGMVGMGRIGKAIARRLEAFGVPVVYHARNPQSGVSYKYYPLRWTRHEGDRFRSVRQPVPHRPRSPDRRAAK